MLTQDLRSSELRMEKIDEEPFRYYNFHLAENRDEFNGHISIGENSVGKFKRDASRRGCGFYDGLRVFNVDDRVAVMGMRLDGKLVSRMTDKRRNEMPADKEDSSTYARLGSQAVRQVKEDLQHRNRISSFLGSFMQNEGFYPFKAILVQSSDFALQDLFIVNGFNRYNEQYFVQTL